jgi:putative flippase GtrA
MALISNRPVARVWRKAHTTLGIRFGRFAVAAISAFATSEILYTICAGPLALSATKATLAGWFSGAVVSYLLSRWTWERKGRPNLLKETLPFCVVSAIVIVILELADKYLGYHPAAWMHLRGAERALYLAAVYGVANLFTFLMRFLFFHYVLFAQSPAPPGAIEEAVASTDSGPEPFAVAAESTGPMRALGGEDPDGEDPDGEDPPEGFRRER